MVTRIHLLIILITSSYSTYSQIDIGHENTHGKEVKDFIAPYLHNFCKQENIDCDSLKKLVLKNSIRIYPDTSFECFSLSSLKHVNGSWTYFRARTPLIYHIAKIDSNKLLILYNKLPPKQILESMKSEWNIALIDSNLRIIEDKIFITPWKYSNESIAMWDMINTDLEVHEKNISIRIIYVHTGGGGGRDQQFTIKSTFTNNKLSPIIVKQTRDDMD